MGKMLDLVKQIDELNRERKKLMSELPRNYVMGSEAYKKQVQKIAKKFNAPMLITKDKLLEELIFKPEVKVMAITDKALTDAIMQNFEEEFICE